MFDRFIHIWCSLLSSLLCGDNLNAFRSWYRGILMNGTRMQRLVHLFHKCIEKHLSFLTAEYISLILSRNCWGLFRLAIVFHRSLISRVRASSIHYGLGIRGWLHIICILRLCLLLPQIVWWLSRRWSGVVVRNSTSHSAVIFHNNHHHPSPFPLRFWLLLSVVKIGSHI